jgi:glycylpeptide N-tetradecanoyltransferase
MSQTLTIITYPEISLVYNLLKDNYVEDDTLCFHYRMEFLQWLLKDALCVGFINESKELVGFLSGTPTTINGKQMLSINLLCLHKSIRAQRLTPVLIEELTKIAKPINCAIYTSGTLLKNPIISVRYWHKPLQKPLTGSLTGSSSGSSTGSLTGFRRMESSDIDQTYDIFNNFQKGMSISVSYDKDMFKHWFLPRKDIISSYVVEDSGNIIAFCSYYHMQIKNKFNDEISNVAYSFYNISKEVSMSLLMNNVLASARDEGLDMYTCLEIMDTSFFKDLEFIPGTGTLNYYFHNYSLGFSSDVSSGVSPETLGIVLM